MTAHTAAGRTGYGSTWTQKGALVFGVVFLIVGIAGFVPGLTMDMGTMSAAGNGSMAHLLGLFQVSVLHNIVHLLFGIVGLSPHAPPRVLGCTCSSAASSTPCCSSTACSPRHGERRELRPAEQR